MSPGSFTVYGHVSIAHVPGLGWDRLQDSHLGTGRSWSEILYGPSKTTAFMVSLSAMVNLDYNTELAAVRTFNQRI